MRLATILSFLTIVIIYVSCVTKIGSRPSDAEDAKDITACGVEEMIVQCEAYNLGEPWPAVRHRHRSYPPRFQRVLRADISAGDYCQAPLWLHTSKDVSLRGGPYSTDIRCTIPKNTSVPIAKVETQRNSVYSRIWMDLGALEDCSEISGYIVSSDVRITSNVENLSGYIRNREEAEQRQNDPNHQVLMFNFARNADLSNICQAWGTIYPWYFSSDRSLPSGQFLFERTWGNHIVDRRRDRSYEYRNKGHNFRGHFARNFRRSWVSYPRFVSYEFRSYDN